MRHRILDCKGYTPDCSTKNQQVDANPDIAGIGVIVGFLSTTCVAFLIAFSVLFLDRYERIVNLLRRILTKNKNIYVHDPKGPYWRSPGFWSRVLSKNLLAFSDTQLLTGLAIQFTAMLQHCKLSVYHFRIVAELAFLTTVTHLLALVALRNYFVRNKWINLPRIFFMLGNLGLLGYTSFVAYSYDKADLDRSSSLACFYQSDDRPPFKTAFGTKYAALLIGGIGGHATVIAAMYLLKEEHLQKGEMSFKWAGAIFRTWIIAPVYAIYGIVMAGISFKNTQALGAVTDVYINGSEEDWGFGQFLPVLLLALPVFAGWESFWEEKDEDRENRFGRSSRPSQGGSQSVLNMFEIVDTSLNREKRSSRDNSVVERTIESDRPSPLGTPRERSTSRTSISPHPTPIPSPHLPVPESTASLLLDRHSSPQTRPKSPSNFGE